MRLIDADKIVEIAEHAYGEWNKAMAAADGRQINRCFKMQELCKAVKSVADDCPTIDPESLRPTAHWVSVKDRLPDPYEKVLVRLDHWAGVDTYLAFYDTERGWCDYGGYFDDGTNNEGEPHTYETAGVNVTHWMSLTPRR